MTMLIKTAKKLPEPTDDDRMFYQIAREAYADQAIAEMDQITAKMRALPEDSEIRKIFAGLSEDEEIPELQEQFDQLYR